eukprot:scaffold21.g2185.t1
MRPNAELLTRPSTAARLKAPLTFELVDFGEENFRLAVAACVEAFNLAVAWLERLRPIPKTSLRNKLPFHRAAALRPELVFASAPQEALLAARRAPPRERVPLRSATRRRPRYPLRDAFAAKRLSIVNLVLVNVALVLAVFIQALEGQRLVVELRRDTIVRGTLLAADDQLNLQLGAATVQPLQGPARQAEFLYVRGRSVRYVHLPPNLDPGSAIAAHRRRVADAVRRHAATQQTAQQAEGRRAKGAAAEGDVITIVDSEAGTGAGWALSVVILSKTIMGAGMAALPKAFVLVGAIVAVAFLLLCGFLTHFSIQALTLGTLATGVRRRRPPAGLRRAPLGPARPLGGQPPPGAEPPPQVLPSRSHTSPFAPPPDSHAGHMSYPAVVGALCGRAGSLLLELSLVFRCAGLMVVYVVVSADILAGGHGMNGLLCDLAGAQGGWCASRPLVSGVVTVLFFAPLVAPRRLSATAGARGAAGTGSAACRQHCVLLLWALLAAPCAPGGKRGAGASWPQRHPLTPARPPTPAVTSALGLGSCVVWAGCTALLAGVAVARGMWSHIYWTPNWDELGHNPAEIATQIAAVIPILATAYTCQASTARRDARMTVHHIMRDMRKFSDKRMSSVSAAAVSLCTLLFLLVALGSAAVFGDDVPADVLQAFDFSGLAPLLGPAGARVVYTLVCLSFLLSVCSIFPMQMAPYRESLSRVLAGAELRGAPYYLLTYASLALFYGTATVAGSIWRPLQFVGATAGALIAFFFPAWVTLRALESDRAAAAAAASPRYWRWSAWALVVLGAVQAVTGVAAALFLPQPGEH